MPPRARRRGTGPIVPSWFEPRSPESLSSPPPIVHDLDALLDAALVGHFALQADGHPVVVPTAIARDGDSVLAHGSTGSRWMRALATGAPTALAVTLLDGIVVARSAFESSMHYRSAVLFGCVRAGRATPAEKRAALDLITDALLPGPGRGSPGTDDEGAGRHSRAAAADRSSGR